MVLGIIGEDPSDIDVMKELTVKLIPHTGFSVKHFASSGCGKLRRKCRAWAEILLRRGCSYLIVVHDLDTEDETKLRNDLQTRVKNVPFRSSVIIIPVREIEAWLLSDGDALQKVFGLKKRPKVPRNPEDIQRPKEHLRDLIWQSGKKRYINTIHNKKIATALSLTELNRCRSFIPYPKFIKDINSRG